MSRYFYNHIKYLRKRFATNVISGDMKCHITNKNNKRAQRALERSPESEDL